MKIKRKYLNRVIAISIILIVITVGLIITINRNSYTRKISNLLKETEHINTKAYDLRQSNPDSSIILYDNSIKELIPLIKSDTISHILSLTYTKLAKIYILKGDYNKADSILNNSLSLRLGKNDLEIEAIVAVNQGDIEIKKSNFDSASILYNKASTLVEKIGNKILKAKVSSNKGVICATCGDFDQAEKLFNESLSIGLKVNDIETIGGAYLNIGVVKDILSQYGDAEKNYNKAISYYLKNNSKADLTLAYQNLANLYFLKENYSKAIDYYNKSLVLAKEIGDKMSTSKLYHNIAEVYRTIGDNQTAINMYMKSISIKEKIENKQSLAKSYRSIGILYTNEKNYTKAFEYYTMAYKIDSALNLVEELAQDYSGFVVIYSEKDNEALMLLNANLALKYSSKIQSKFQKSEINVMLGNYYATKNKYPLAFAYYDKALKLKQNTDGNKEGTSSLYNQMAELYLKNKNYNTTKKYAYLSYSIANSLKIPYLIKDASSTLASAYKNLNNYKSAYNYLLISKQYNDSLFDAAKADALTFAEARWNNEKKQQEITNLQKLNKATIAKNEAERKSNRIVIISIILVALLILIILLVLWINNKNKEKIKQQEQLNRMSLIRLQNIRNRISPHFMFNALNQQIIKDEDEEQTNTILQLTSLLRKSLEMTDNIAIPLTDEIEFVKNYLQIEGKRMGNDFITAWDIDNSISGDDWKIPAMFIQIPVENALKHALKMKAGEKRLKIKINKADIHLIIEITDNGEGYVPGRKSIYSSTGTGLNVIFQTIDILNKKNKMPILIDITNLKGKGLEGTSVKIQIPQEYEY